LFTGLGYTLGPEICGIMYQVSNFLLVSLTNPRSFMLMVAFKDYGAVIF